MYGGVQGDEEFGEALDRNGLDGGEELLAVLRQGMCWLGMIEGSDDVHKALEYRPCRLRQIRRLQMLRKRPVLQSHAVNYIEQVLDVRIGR